MTQALDQSIIELLNASADDADSLQFPVNDRTFGFHAQQAIEKLLKALIGGHVQKFALTHDLKSLTEQLAELDENLPVDLALVQSLTNYASVWRYQEPQPLAVEQRGELLLTVSTLRTFVVGRLCALRPTVNWVEHVREPRR